MEWTEAFIIAGEICDYLASQGLEMPTPAQQERMATLIAQRNGMKWSNHNQSWYTAKPPAPGSKKRKPLEPRVIWKGGKPVDD